MAMGMIVARGVDGRFGDGVLSERKDSRLVAVNPDHEVTHVVPPHTRRGARCDRVPFYARRARSASVRPEAHPPVFATASSGISSWPLNPQPLTVAAARFPLDRAGATSVPRKRSLQMKIRPLSDRILVKRVAEQQKTAGGLHIPDSAKEKPLEAMIVAVGSGKVQDDGSRRAPTGKIGDKVLLAKYSGSEIGGDGIEHL